MYTRVENAHDHIEAIILERHINEKHTLEKHLKNPFVTILVLDMGFMS